LTVLRSGSASDVGRVRTVNEDRWLESLTLFAVADGMGGHAGGEVAAAIAIESLEGGFARTPTIDGLVAAVQEANRAVWERGAEDQTLRGMGTTVVAAALVATGDGDRLVLVNVGDSRVYRFHTGELSQLSVDHSVAEELVARGELSEAEAAVHPHRHILTRALGVSPAVEVDLWQVVPEEGDRYLLCSDGLTNEVQPDAISEVLTSVRDPHAAAEQLVALANAGGGNDNVTAVVLDVLVGEPVETDEAATADAAAADDPAAAVAVPAEGALPTGAGEALPAPAVAGPVTRPAPAPLPSKVYRRKIPRRITFRVLFFLVLLAALAVATWLVIRFYVDDSYYVGLQGNQVVIYQGRPGGFLGFEPKVVTRTGVTKAEVGPLVVPALKAGVQEPTKSAARKYVSNLVDAECSLVNPPASCASTTTTTTTVPVTTTPSATTALGIAA
jgi:protein phosphatase